MAVTDYQITPAGNKKVLHAGVVAHAGRLVQMDPANPVTALLLKNGYIATPTTATQHDHLATNPHGVPATEGLQTYTTQAKEASQKLQHNGVTLNPGATLQLDPLDPTTTDLINRGIIA